MFVKNSRWLTALLFLAAILLTGFSAPSKDVKATWVWQTELIEDGGEKLLEFARNEGINLIYLQINRDLPKRPMKRSCSTRMRNASPSMRSAAIRDGP